MKTLYRLIIFLSLGSPIANSCKKEYSCESCNPVNQLPVADAGADQSFNLPKDSTFLNGEASSDTDGTITSFQWKKISGPVSFYIEETSASKTVLRSLAAGSYQFELRVTDNKGAVATDTVVIIVNEANATNQSPGAHAGPDQTIILPDNSAVLTGNASTDPDNNIVNYAWSKIEGPAVTIVDAHAIQTPITNLSEGVYRFELKVTDAEGLFSKDTVSIIVSFVAIPSLTAIGDIILAWPLNYVYLDGSHNWNNTAQWEKISGPSQFLFEDTHVAIPLVKNLVPGSYTFRLNTGDPYTTLRIIVTVISDPQEKNTLTYNKLRWAIGDIYGTGTNSLHLLKPDWLEKRPVEVYLNLNSASNWFKVPSVQNGVNYNFDGDSYRLWVLRIPEDPSLAGKESSIKIKFF